MTNNELVAALEDAYRFITQPQVMHTPANGPKTATYRIEGYNALTAKLRAAIASARADAWLSENMGPLGQGDDRDIIDA